MQDHVMVDEPDASLFQLVSSQALQSLLDRIVGPKTLVLSSSLAGPLGLITEVGLLKVSEADLISLGKHHLFKQTIVIPVR